ncbi:MAG: tetratricopeptide repeat-containing sensor histidine kinase [Bacteroidales bacterium]|jgi:signal transduction histidine kinase|nr:tetratricopeptide repeat-containing sensor histidine kinase [Bacteroidales bacterium]
MKASKFFLILFVAFFIVQGLLFPTAYGQSGQDEVISKIRAASPDSLATMLELANKQVMSEPIIANKRLKALYRRFEELDDKEKMLETLDFLSSNYYYLAEIDSCLLMLRVAKSMLPLVDKVDIYFRVFNQFGAMFTRIQQYDSASFYLEKAEELVDEVDGPMFKASLYNNLGALSSAKGKYQESFTEFLKARDYSEEAGDFQSVAILDNNFGRISQAVDDYEGSIAYFESAIEINKTLGDLFNLSMNYNNLGISLSNIGRLEEALEVYQKALSINVDQGFMKEQARAHLNIADVFLKMGDTSRAKSNLLKSLQICEQYDIKYGIMICSLELGDIYFNSKDFKKALAYVNRAEGLAKQDGSGELLVKVYALKANLLTALNNLTNAIDYKNKYITLNDSLTKTANKNLLLELKTKYETEKKTLENQSLKFENENKSRIIYWQHISVAAFVIIFLVLIILIINVLRGRKKLENANQNLKELNQKIVDQNKLLKETVSTKNKILAILGHDLRSPFSSMLGLFEMMLADYDSFNPEEKRRIFELIFTQVSDTYNTVDNVLNWALNQQGKIISHPQEEKLFDIVERIRKLFDNIAVQKQINILNEVPQELTAFVDKDLISTVLRNLINNALKFSFKDGTIVIKAIELDDKVKIQVIDNGRGMNASKLNLLMSDETLVSERGTDNETGTGLGFHIVKDFIKLQQGSIIVESEEGKGSIFSIELPRFQ